MGMGNTGVARNQNNQSIKNTAHLALLDNNSIYLSYRNFYFVEGLNYLQVTGNYKTGNKSAISIGLSKEGSTELSETLVNLNYARKIFNKGAIGIGVSFYHEGKVETKSINTIIPNIGLQIEAIPSLTLGLQLNNPIPYQHEGIETIPGSYNFGACYKINELVYLSSEISLSSNEETLTKFGIEYFPIHQISLRTGYIENGSITFGISYDPNKQIRIETAYELHPILRSSIGIGINYTFINNDKK